MTLRGKDYCNCDHAQMLRKAIETASAVALADPDHARQVLNDALADDHAACMDLWGDLKEAIG